MGIVFSGFNVGTDAAVVIADAFGDVFPAEALGLLMEFDSESTDRELEAVPISQGGIPVFQTIWAGGRGRMMFTRANGAMSNLVSTLMQAYYNSGLISQFTLSLAVLNRDGSIDDYLYTGVQLSRPRLGNFRSEKEVDMQIEFRWAQLILTASPAPALPALAAAA